MAGPVRWAVLIVIFVSAVSCAEDYSFEGCVRRDSISCVQVHVYRKLRALFGQDTINLLAGFQFVKNEGSAGARSLDDNLVDDKMFSEDAGVAERQTALEDFTYEKISNFFSERSFKWSLSPAVEQVANTARMAVTSIPDDLREKLTTFVVEGRGKKKLLKSLIPIIMLVKAKVFAIAYLLVSVLTKKALVVSTIALLLTVFISIKKALSKHHTPVYYEIHSDSHHSPIHSSHPDRSGWAPAWSGGWDSYSDAHGSPSSHHLAYSAQKPNLR